MGNDTTENVRREFVRKLNAEPKGEPSRTQARSGVGHRRTATRLRGKGFPAPLVVVRRRSDGVLGTLFFQHEPRFYFGFSPD